MWRKVGREFRESVSENEWLPLLNDVLLGPPSSWHLPQGPNSQESHTFTALTRFKQGKGTLLLRTGPQGLTAELLSWVGQAWCSTLRWTKHKQKEESFWRSESFRWVLLLSGTHRMFKRKKCSSSSGDVVSTCVLFLHPSCFSVNRSPVF